MNDTPPITQDPRPARARRPANWALLAFLLLAASIVLVRLVSRRSDDPGRPDWRAAVSVAVREFETNANGSVRAFVAIRNDSDQLLEFGYGTQIRVAEGWAHTNGNLTQFRLRTESDSLLPPQSERLVTVQRPASGEPWRVVAMCWTPADEAGRRGKPIQIPSPEISP